MNNKELIETEFEKINFSEMNLHKLLGSFIKNHNIICNERNWKEYNKMFISNSFIISLIDFLKINNDLFEYNFINENSYQAIKIKHTNLIEDLDISYNYYSKCKYTCYQIYYQNSEITQKIWFSNSLNSEIILHVDKNLGFNINSKTHIKENSKTINKNLFNINTTQNSKILNMVSSLKILGDSIINNNTLEDAFDLLNLQNDFLDEKFKKNVIHYFKTNNKIEQHNDLINELKELKNIEKNNILVKKAILK